MKEELAALLYEFWGDGMRHVFLHCETGDDGPIIPWKLFDHWRRQVEHISYTGLFEEKQREHQRQADKVLELLAEKLLVADTVVERSPEQSMPERVAEAHYALVGGNSDKEPVPVDVIARWLAYIEKGVNCEEPGVPAGANFDGDWGFE